MRSKVITAPNAPISTASYISKIYKLDFAQGAHLNLYRPFGLIFDEVLTDAYLGNRGLCPLFHFPPSKGRCPLRKRKKLFAGAHNFFSSYPYSSAHKFTDERGQIPRQNKNKTCSQARIFYSCFAPFQMLCIW